ncbi:NAD(P)/FAD-dependent oxidoreductase [Phenylobacterium aquaticum]|uniref:NAD(P)/FAD-dependent oxidoreductase n=1 Tax=Phenylobacterium aquaticum TaxID=1763816 RepID=UPI001F5CE435|nr:FAD-dependent oxidoreductase [Phenylobacterium aquaticum]MCI3135653.1 FAD-dependent oxidoreductase [Phenylobacterium aquaticum]
MKVAIVGAGLAGLSCATALSRAGADVVLFDKGRGPGGRMSSRRMATPAGEAVFDHGAQYFTARDPDFAAQVAAWATAGVCAPWPAAGADAWVGTPAMNAPIRALAGEAAVTWNCQVEALVAASDGWRLQTAQGERDPFDRVVLATPAEQVSPLAAQHAPEMAACAGDTRSAPCWTLMLAFAERLPVEADVLRDRGPIGWAARNSAKPGRAELETWVIQASPEWSAAYLERDADDVAGRLAEAFAQATGVILPPALARTAHRWRYARAGAAGLGALWRPDLGLGCCGDWLIGPRVECAWLSGRDLARRMIA